MITKLVKIGNSRGIRLPKHLIDKYDLEGSLKIEETTDGLKITSSKGVREGWDEAFDKAGLQKDDLDDFRLIKNKFDEEEWTW